MSETSVEVFVSAGSNIDPLLHLRSACQRLIDALGPLRLSPVYETRAVGFDGADFLNLVLAFSTTLSAVAINDLLRRVEDAEGRERGGSSFSSRTLDLDLLLHGDAVLKLPELTIPRDEILKYAFVLKPMVDLAPTLEHPTERRTMAQLWSAFDSAEQPIRQLTEPLL